MTTPENLDLDIRNYTIQDLEVFFKVSGIPNYKAADLELNEYEIRQQLFSSGQVDRRFKRDLIEFLTLAKNQLIDAKCPPVKPPTSIPKDYQLDPYEYPRSAQVPPRTTELTNRDATQFIYTNPGEFYPGDLNPLNTRILTRCLNIDTRFRDNFYTTQSSDFIIQMPEKFNKVVSMELSAIEIPTQFYTISSHYGNNFLYMQVSTDLSGSAPIIHQIFTISDGNYIAADLVSAINLAICPRNGDGSIQNPNSIFSYIQFSLNINANGTGTNKLTLAPTGTNASHVKSITLDFTMNSQGYSDNITPLASKLGWNLGFIKSTYKDATTYTADTCINLQTIKYMYFAVEDFFNNSNHSFINVFQKSLTNPSILARISMPTRTADLPVIVSEPRKYFGPVDIQRMRIRLFDEYGRTLYMNSSDYSFCLSLKMMYDL